MVIMPTFSVSIPDIHTLVFREVEEFDTRAEAIQYATDVWGADENGCLSLIIKHPDNKENDS